MFTSRIFPAYISLLSVVRAAVPTTVPVYSGPQAVFPTAREFFIIGCNDPLASGMSLAVEGSSDWGALGAQSRTELFGIKCVYVTWNGDADVDAAMSTAAATIGLVETALRGNVDLTQSFGRSGWAGLSITQVQATQDTAGAALHCMFDIVCSARI